MHPIDIESLTVAYNKFIAVNDLCLKVEAGQAVALLGENGAGKTTTLRTLVGIIKPTQAEGSVMGQAVGKLGQAEFAKIGYVSENQKLHKSWTLKQLLNYLRPMYPTWDQKFCDELVSAFALPLNKKLSSYSRGMQMKASLVSSLAYRPELLILDEPFSGLDPLVREELIDAILELMQGGNWTVLISSHDILEVERLCDEAAFINEGKITIQESLDTLQERFRAVDLFCENGIDASPQDTWLNLEQNNRNHWTFVIDDYSDQAEQDLKNRYPDAQLQFESLSLREIYLTLARHRKKKTFQAIG